MEHPLAFKHRFEPGARAGAPALLMLHGTGGDENDLLPLGRMIAPGAALLSPRGKVLENGMPRFFQRLAEGVFDEADVRLRAQELADFVEAASRRYHLSAPFAVGYSNGANIAAAMLYLRPEVLAGAALLRAMVPLSAPPSAALEAKPILILSGAMDPIASADGAIRLASQLEAAGGRVVHRILCAGHELSQFDIAAVRSWLASQEDHGMDRRAGQCA